MSVRLIGLLAVILSVTTLLAAQPADAARVDEARCFVSVEADQVAVLDFENVESAQRIAVRYEDKWVTTLQNPVATWTAPSAASVVAASYEIVLWPGGERVRCSGEPLIAQLDLGADNQACSFVDGSDSRIAIWGDFRGVTHVRNQQRWIARLPDGSSEFFDDRLADSRAVLRYRASGQRASVDVVCSDEPVVPVRFATGGAAISPPAEPSLENANFNATLVGRTALVTDTRSGQTRSYQMSADDTLVHISTDGRYLHWYRQGNPARAVAADLHELRQAPTGLAVRVAEAQEPRATEPARAIAAPAVVVHVSTDGRANGGGFTNTRIRRALRDAQAGTVFQFAPGEHKPIQVSNVRGDQGNPIVITAADANKPPTFIDRSYSGRAGIRLSDSANVTISNVNVRESLWGIRIDDASVGIEIDAVTIDDIGQEAIRITERSSNVVIRNSTITNTGRRPGTTDDGEPFSHFGEGIYLGTGRDNGDEVHHITIEGNTISRTTAEAIDIKQPVRDVVIANNTIRNIRTTTTGAIAVHIEKDFAATNPNIDIISNTISNITTSSGSRDGVGIVIGSSVDIIGNQITNTQHYAIRIDDDGSQGSRITANVRNNTISNAGIRAIHQSGRKATVNTSNNRR